MKTILKIAALAASLTLIGLPSWAQHAGHSMSGGGKSVKAPDWTTMPMLSAASGFSRTGARFQAYNMHAMQAVSYAAYAGRTEQHLEAARTGLAVDDSGKLSVSMGEDGGYYLVRVIGHGPGGEEAIATTIKYFSKPGAAPRELLKAGRPGFELAPAVLPREHSHYRENETWPFVVRMDGAPVEGATVTLETSNGTKTEFVTNADGMADVTFPKDFKDIPKDQWSHGRPPYSQFVLSVRDGGLLATFNGDYSLDAFGNKNLWAGLGFALLGMIAAVPVVRRRKQA